MQYPDSLNSSIGHSDPPEGTYLQSEAFRIMPTDTEILNGYLDEFQRAETHARSTILEKAMGDIYRQRPGDRQFDKKEAKLKLRKWFYNHSGSATRRRNKFVRNWSARNVFYHDKRDDIGRLAQEMSGAAPGSQAYLGALQNATTHFWKDLSEEEQDEYEDMARDWSENGPPSHIQTRMASAAIRGRIIHDFQTQLYRTCGVRTVVFMAFASEDGTPQVAIDEWNSCLDNGMDFDDFFPTFRKTELWAQWRKYSRYCFGTDEDRIAINAQAKSIKTPIVITTDTNGEPQIPSVTGADGNNTKTVQTALRDYCTAHIRFVSGKKKARVSWAKLVADPDAWIENESYPPGFQWADPSKIRKDAVFHIFDHWRQRKNSGLSPIIWNSSCDVLSDIERPYKYLRTAELRRTGEIHQRDANNSGISSEEDFRQELDQISEDDLESQHSSSPTTPTADTREASGGDPTHMSGPIHGPPTVHLSHLPDNRSHSMLSSSQSQAQHSEISDTGRTLDRHDKRAWRTSFLQHNTLNQSGSTSMELQREEPLPTLRRTTRTIKPTEKEIYWRQSKKKLR